MKLFRAIALSLTLTAAICAGVSAATLASNGKSEYAIVVSKDASASEKHAAAELQHFIKEISNAELPVVTEGGTAPKKMIVLGDGETLRSLGVKINFKDLGDEGFAIKTAGPHLVIAGGRLRGTMYGVYTFLEDVLGCRWYTSYVSRIPKKNTIGIRRLNITKKPDFEYREPYYMDAWNADWAARNKVNGFTPELDEARGGKVMYVPFVHTFNYLLPPDVYFKDHPEYFALHHGRRKPSQLCLSNPDVQRIALETVMRWMETNPQAHIFSVSQNDNYDYCQCENCRAVDEEEGTPSGIMLRFVNRIADEAARKYPDKLIDTLAYQYTQKAPRMTVPRPNVCVRLCVIENCQFHAYDECVVNAALLNDLRGWDRISDNLYIWHYNTNFRHYLFPMPDLVQLADSISLYKNSGVKGVFAQGTGIAGNGPYGGPGFMDSLRQYLIAKLLWNSKADPRAITNDFLNGYYGKAGKPIGRFLDLLHETVRKENIHGIVHDNLDHPQLHVNARYSPHLTPEIIAQCDRLFDEAERLAESPEILARVRHARLGMDFVKIQRSVGDAKNKSREEKDRVLADLESFVETCRAGGIERISDPESLEDFWKRKSAVLR